MNTEGWRRTLLSQLCRLLQLRTKLSRAENCSWEEDGGVKNVNGDCGRQGNKSCAFNKPRPRAEITTQPALFWGLLFHRWELRTSQITSSHKLELWFCKSKVFTFDSSYLKFIVLLINELMNMRAGITKYHFQYARLVFDWFFLFK